MPRAGHFHLITRRLAPGLRAHGVDDGPLDVVVFGQPQRRVEVGHGQLQRFPEAPRAFPLAVQLRAEAPGLSGISSGLAAADE
jgi:hypothetical protein